MSDLITHVSARSKQRGDVRQDITIVVVVFALGSVIAALIWKATAELPQWQNRDGRVVMDALNSSKTMSIDACYALVSIPIALILGVALMWWRRRSPVVAVFLIALVSVCAAALMERVGLWLGPSDPIGVLRSAPDLASASVQLQVQASGVLLVWPAAAVLGALLVLLLAPAEQFDTSAEAQARGGDEIDAISTVASN